MGSEKRRSLRQNVNGPAWIDVGGGAPFTRCKLTDISETGAQLVVEDTDDVPDSFTLHLAGHGLPCHLCNVVWRRDNAMGIEFQAVSNRDISETKVMWRKGLESICSQWYESCEAERRTSILPKLASAALNVGPLQRASAMFTQALRVASASLV